MFLKNLFKKTEKVSKYFYITTTLPYVNADPHIGHAVEFVRADAIARYKKLTGSEIFFNTGTDEHGQKIYNKASEVGKTPKEFVDIYVARVHELLELLNVGNYGKNINFIRTTDENHIISAQAFWKKCDEAGDIYKKLYETKYCVGCELEKTDSELVNGKCPDHSNLSIEIRKEENYFFRFSKYQGRLLELYKKNPDFVVPASRLNEITKFVERGLQDFSISRLKSKMPWGIEVPNDPLHIMYVWFDALVNYVSAVGWPSDEGKYKKWLYETGGMVQYCGKDNLRQQSAMWQAMLMSAGLPNSKQIIVDGFILGAGGIKMSKTLGNVLSPFEVIKEYGTDAVRYFLLREASPFEDSEFTMEKFKEAYNANLANGLGNLVSRIMKMATSYGVSLTEEEKLMHYYSSSKNEIHEALDRFSLAEEMNDIWSDIAFLDNYIQKNEPFKKIKVNIDEAKKDVRVLLFHLLGVVLRLEPFMPEASLKIQQYIKENKMPEKPLFLRKE